jgi:hypothetical protein
MKLQGSANQKDASADSCNDPDLDNSAVTA